MFYYKTFISKDFSSLELNAPVLLEVSLLSFLNIGLDINGYSSLLEFLKNGNSEFEEMHASSKFLVKLG